MLYYQSPSIDLWRGRKDSLPGERYFQSVQVIDLEKQTLPSPTPKHYVLHGFCCDAGIERNEGRLGAKEGPYAFRPALANLALPSRRAYTILDSGNTLCPQQDLLNAQNQLAELTGDILKQGHRLILIGGGHEMAWGHYQGIRRAYPDLNLGIINIDAHFDLRPLPQDGIGTSGTSFFQIANHCKKHELGFNYLCIGIQESSNTESLWQTANQFKVEIIKAQTLQEEALSDSIKKIEEFIHSYEAIYLSLCLDVFASSIAPGVSAPQALGLFPWHLNPLLRFIAKTGKVISMEIAELSPPHDHENRTASLAANMLNIYLNAYP